MYQVQELQAPAAQEEEDQVIIGISGKAGSGKDTVADFLVKNHSFVKVSLADPLKRICQDVFGFSYAQLWGPSEMRNAPDERYPRSTFLYGVSEPKSVKLIDGRLPPSDFDGVEEAMKNMKPVTEYLTPRRALQQLGTEWGRACYPNIWIEYGLRVAKRLEDRVTLGDRLGDPMGYLPELGLVPLHEHPSLNDDISGTVFADIRFKNEVAEFKKAGAKLIRIVRGGAGLSGAAAQHVSEAEQDQIPDTEFDAVIHNEGTLEDLRLQVESVLRMLMTSAQEEKNSEDLFRFLDGKEVIVTSMTTTYPEGSSIVQEEIPMEIESIAPLQTASGTLAELLKKREEDVKAGKLMEYDESQKDIPPFKRKKNP